MMNKKYIKRQLTLQKLGYDMSEDIQLYYNELNNIIGDVDKLDKRNVEKYGFIIWERNEDNIFKYYLYDKNIYVDRVKVWQKFMHIDRSLEDYQISDILTPLLEEFLNIEIEITHWTLL